jgi:lipopolysaccharide export system protein LptA
VKRALILLALAAAPATAQELDLSRGGPITVDARDGFEWRENERIVIATGDARANRGTTTVIADKLVAYYRKKAVAAAASPQVGAASTEGGNEIYRLIADGNVRIFTPTDEARGQHAVYDIDQSVLVLTGGKLSMTTPQQLITARDSLEYWSAKHMSVARGNAVVITSDARRLAGDVLVGYSEPTPDTPKSGKAPAQPGGSGDLKRIEAYGNVEVRTATDIVRGARGVYVTETQIARVVDGVRITHGDSQMNGAAADINMATGIAHLVSPPGRRVQGLIVPNEGKTTPGKKP